MAKLFEISNDFAELFDRFEDFNEMEDPAEKEAILQAWYDTLEGIESEFEIKAESIGQYIKQLRVEIAAMKEEEQRLAQRRRTKEHNAEGLSIYLKTCMEQVHRDKIDTPRCRISLRNNAETVQIDNESLFVRMLQQHGRDDLLRYKEPEIRKTEVKKLLQSGEVFHGARLIRTRSLVIK